MNRLFRYFVERSFLVNLVTLFVVIVGLYSFSSMKRDLIPAWQWPSISVTTDLVGASSAEIEKFVTYPIEEALQGLPGVTSINSTSSSGLSRIKIEYPFGSGDLDEELDQIRDRVNGVRAELPAAVRDVRVSKDKNTQVFLMASYLVGFDLSNPEHLLILRKYKEGLLEVPGVVHVSDEAPDEGIFIDIDRERANRLGLSAQDLRTQLMSKLHFTPVGQYQKGDSEIFIEINQSLGSLEQIKSIPLRTSRSAADVHLSDVAKVEFRPGRETTIAYLNGTPALSIRAMKSLDSDSIELKEKVAEYNETFNASLPEGLRLEVLVDGAHFIEKQLEILSSNGWIGLVFVVLLLILFLNWKTSVVVAIGVPVAYLGTLTILHSLGIAFDLFSVVGLILVLGMLVDDAIIVSEKYNENLELGLPPKDAATAAARQLFVPVTGAILTTVVAFLPILFIQSWVSVILYSTPIIVISALTLSLIESFFILPNHLAHSVRKPQISRSTEIFSSLRTLYVKVSSRLLRFRYAMALAGFAIIGAAGYLAVSKLKHNFNLHIDVISVAANITLKESNSLNESYKQIRGIEKDLLAISKDKTVENMTTYIGNVWRDGRERKGYKYAKITFFLDRNATDPDLLKENIKSKIRPIIERHKDAFAELTMAEEFASDNEATKDLVSLKVEGRDELSYFELEQQITEALQNQKLEPNVLKELIPSEGYQLSWRFVPDQKALLNHGLTVQGVASQSRSQFLPDEVGEVRYMGQSVKVLLDSQAKDIEFSDLNQFPVVNSIGEIIPSSFVGDWIQSKVQKSIAHRDLKKSMKLDFKFDPEKGNQIQARAQLSELVKGFEQKYPTVDFTVEDGSKEETAAKDWSMKIALICITAVLFILALTLNSLTLPLLAAIPIPFGLSSIVFALYLHDLPLGIMAIVGLVGTVGVCVNASLIMVDEVNRLSFMSGGWSHENILIGSSKRLRAIIISILTTLAGVAPMAYGIGGDSSFLQPLAFSMFWGLLASTLITLFFLPAFMAIHLDLRRAADWILRRTKAREHLPQIHMDRSENKLETPARDLSR